MKQTFFYKAKIQREDGPAIREGTIQAKFPVDALDAIADMAISTWKRPLVKVELHEINKDGALVATDTKIQDRIDAVLKTHKALFPHSNTAKIAKEREKRKARKSKSPVTETWDWHMKIGTRYSSKMYEMPSTWR